MTSAPVVMDASSTWTFFSIVSYVPIPRGSLGLVLDLQLVDIFMEYVQNLSFKSGPFAFFQTLFTV